MPDTTHATASVAPDRNCMSCNPTATGLFVLSEGAGQLQARQQPRNCKRRTRPQLHVPQHGCNWTFVLSEGAAGEGVGQLHVRH